MKKVLVLLLFLLGIEATYAQITIVSSDMHVVNDTVRTSVAYNTDMFDFTATGADFTWNFGSLIPAAQLVDTFYAVNTLPLTIYLFYMTSANLVKPFQITDLLPNTIGEIPDIKIYQLFNNTSNSFKDVGYGIELDGLGIPLKYSQADEIYRFPMTYAQAFNSNAFLDTNIPSVGTIYIDRQRQSEVDGWGSITTPYGTFEALRYRSVVYETDSIDLPSYEISQRFERNYTEYHWLTKESGTPILKVHIEEGIEMPIVTYVDSARVITIGTDEIEQRKDLVIYPNPTTGILNIQLNEIDSQGDLSIYDITGRIVYQKQILNSTDSTVQIDLKSLGMSSGIFFLNYISENKIYGAKIVVQ
ncbi:MAG: T9SS type A sorting domain-containing protein [Lentimicrobiaceae bacterium]|jgi:hypothetical protein|nr:T9SS type A sorting domain-containing protein [Lentimicrobiaceae bacterium]